MLTQAHLTNFKCFSKKRVFDLSKLNLFTGLNGRGKSSVLQSILLLSQSVYTYNSFRNLSVSSNRWIKLGDFNDILSNKKKSEVILGFRTNQKIGDSEKTAFRFTISKMINLQIEADWLIMSLMENLRQK